MFPSGSSCARTPPLPPATWAQECRPARTPSGRQAASLSCHEGGRRHDRCPKSTGAAAPPRISRSALDGRSCLFSRARAIEEEDVEAPSPTAPCVVWGGRVEQSSGDCSPVVVVALWRGEDGLCECPQPEWASRALRFCKQNALPSLVGATTAGRRHKGWEGVGAAWRGGRIGQPLTRPATPAQPRLCIPGE